MAKINVSKLLEALKAPPSQPDSAFYCYCEGCGFLGEFSLDVFFTLKNEESFQHLEHLDNPALFRKKYYFTIKSCPCCTGRNQCHNRQFDFTDDPVEAYVREISELVELQREGIEFIGEDEIPGKFFLNFSAN
jgi:hypothetical protein